MAGRSRFRRVLGFVVSVIAVAVLMLIGTEYWRATKAGAQYSRALNQDVRGFIGGNTMAGGDDMPATRAADFAATVGALDQANERVRALGEERNQLLQERDQLNQLRNDLTGRLARAEDEVAALQARVGELNSRVDDGSGESARMNQSLRELEERLKTVTAERDRLRDELAAARQQLASNDAQPPSSIAAAPAPVRQPTVERPAASSPSPVPPSQGGPARLTDLRSDAGSPPAQIREITPPAPPASSVQDGIAAYQAGDYAKARSIWEPLAREGIPRAQFHLGSLLFEGRLGSPQLIDAYRWLTLSANNGFGPALAMRDRVRAAMSPQELDQALASLG
ncbi:MAG: hypothetical protein H6851_10105 [Geminicoccaceae bacterium]|nr:hypothetical protein [Geminicoccaceae bacterium]